MFNKHWFWVIIEQVLLGKQQAPVGNGHIVLLQLVLSPLYIPLLSIQVIFVICWQVPLLKQHAPVGNGHGLSKQVVPGPWNIPNNYNE